jgi:type I restriction enzyme S subunit
LKYVEGDVPRELTNGDVRFNNTNSPELIGKTTAILIDSRLAYSNHMTRIRLEDEVNPVFVARQLHFLWMTGYFRGTV